MIKIRTLQHVVIAGLVLGMTTACERGTRDLERWTAETLRLEAEPIDPIPPILTPEIVSYEAYDLRDPFQRRVARADEEVSEEEAVSGGLRPDPERRREFLEGFPLDTLRMVGTLHIDGVEYALVRDNENVVHRVREGNYIGRNHGELQSVASDRVELRELVQDGRGGWIERRVQIAMDDA